MKFNVPRSTRVFHPAWLDAKLVDVDRRFFDLGRPQRSQVIGRLQPGLPSHAVHLIESTCHLAGQGKDSTTAPCPTTSDGGWHTELSIWNPFRTTVHIPPFDVLGQIRNLAQGSVVVLDLFQHFVVPQTSFLQFVHQVDIDLHKLTGQDCF